MNCLLFFLLWAAALFSRILCLDCWSDCCAPVFPSLNLKKKKDCLKSNGSFTTYYSLSFFFARTVARSPNHETLFFLTSAVSVFLTVLHLEFV